MGILLELSNWSSSVSPPCCKHRNITFKLLDLYTGSCMRAHVLLNLLNKLRKKIKCECFSATSLINRPFSHSRQDQINKNSYFRFKMYMLYMDFSWCQYS